MRTSISPWWGGSSVISSMTAGCPASYSTAAFVFMPLLLLMIRIGSQSDHYLPARGDASIPTTHPHRARPYAARQVDASIPTPLRTAPAPTRLYRTGCDSVYVTLLPGTRIGTPTS